MAILRASLVSLVFIEAGSSLLSKLVPEFDQANLNVLHPISTLNGTPVASNSGAAFLIRI
jgi:hypothetical protein